MVETGFLNDFDEDSSGSSASSIARTRSSRAGCLSCRSGAAAALDRTGRVRQTRCLGDGSLATSSKRRAARRLGSAISCSLKGRASTTSWPRTRPRRVVQPQRVQSDRHAAARIERADAAQPLRRGARAGVCGARPCTAQEHRSRRSKQLQLRLESYNALNRANLRDPKRRPRGCVGTITLQNGLPRQLQIAARLIF